MYIVQRFCSSTALKPRSRGIVKEGSAGAFTLGTVRHLYGEGAGYETERLPAHHFL